MTSKKTGTDMTDREALLRLCRTLGEPDRDLVVSAEGNVSMRIDDQTMVIKASGCSLASMSDDDLVDVDLPSVLSLLDGAPSDERTKTVYQAAVRSKSTKMPSVEAVLHAVLYELTSAKVIAHTHPTAVNMLTCSAQAHLLVDGSLYPDAIVMMGRRQVLVPYTDPGVVLARAVRDAVASFMSEEAAAPKVVYLANHGVFVIAESPKEALQVTEMTVKNARILHGTIAVGGPQFLDHYQVDRIDKRPDEAYRRITLNTE
jgi:rhamnose utilization protein RhaD (predicted bifunctional aldolase and dehydrogenase)